ncbi:hypothetical protein, partial [Escherichia coli]|uniref:hypothetical protein n=1 Tax=Escherichia coli TaxID=562 RepID=UPI001BC87A2A
PLYLWHCTREGEYSLYSTDLLNQNFLRGVTGDGRRPAADAQDHLVNVSTNCSPLEGYATLPVALHP